MLASFPGPTLKYFNKPASTALQVTSPFNKAPVSRMDKPVLLPGQQPHFQNINIFIIPLLVHFSTWNYTCLPSWDNLPVEAILIGKSSAWSLCLNFNHPFRKPPVPFSSTLHICICLGDSKWGGTEHPGQGQNAQKPQGLETWAPSAPCILFHLLWPWLHSKPRQIATSQNMLLLLLPLHKGWGPPKAPLSLVTPFWCQNRHLISPNSGFAHCSPLLLSIVLTVLLPCATQSLRASPKPSSDLPTPLRPLNLFCSVPCGASLLSSPRGMWALFGGQIIPELALCEGRVPTVDTQSLSRTSGMQHQLRKQRGDTARTHTRPPWACLRLVFSGSLCSRGGKGVFEQDSDFQALWIASWKGQSHHCSHVQHHKLHLPFSWDAKLWACCQAAPQPPERICAQLPLAWDSVLGGPDFLSCLHHPHPPPAPAGTAQKGKGPLSGAGLENASSFAHISFISDSCWNHGELLSSLTCPFHCPLSELLSSLKHYQIHYVGKIRQKKLNSIVRYL